MTIYSKGNRIYFEKTEQKKWNNKLKEAEMLLTAEKSWVIILSPFVTMSDPFHI